jgi:hypothetical protein
MPRLGGAPVAPVLPNVSALGLPPGRIYVPDCWVAVDLVAMRSMHTRCLQWWDGLAQSG